MDKAQLRLKFRDLRSKLNSKEQLAAAFALAENLFKLPDFVKVKSIAAYWPNDHEINPLLFLEKAMHQGLNCYLPLLMGDNSLLLDFASYTCDTHMQENKFGILEPHVDASGLASIEKLDLIVVPLVAFDKYGTRLGMGAGYYDSTLNKLLDIEPNARPMIVGAAHNCQQAQELPNDNWDWSLSYIVTDKAIIKAQGR